MSDADSADSVVSRVGGLSPAKRAYLERLHSASPPAESTLRSASPPAQSAPAAGLPLSFAQEQLWFLQQLEPDSTAYTVVQAVPFDVADLDAFGRALDVLVARHEILRTRYIVDGEEPVQVIDRSSGMPIGEVDLRVAADLDIAYRAWVEDLAKSRFSLSTGPVLRVSAARLDESRWRVLLAIHHIAVDGWSMSILLDDLGVAYEACAEDRPPSLPPISARYVDHALRQRSAAGQLRVESSLRWWRGRLRGAPQMTLPADRIRPPRPSHHAAIEAVQVDATTTAGLAALARGHGASLFMCVLAAYAVLLSRWTGQTDLLVGCPLAGRGGDFERVVGLFVNTVPVRFQLDDAPTFRDLLARVRTTVLETVEHEEVPFARLVRELAPQRDPGVNPLFQTTFQLTGGRDGGDAARSASRRPVAFDLQVDVGQVRDALAVHFAYATDLFDAATIERMAGNYTTLLASIVAAPDVPVSDLRMLSSGELAQHDAWNATATDIPAVTIDALVAEQAAQHADAVAIEDGELSLTYGQVDSRATALALHLVAAGARPDQPVALLLPRSADLVIAQLAVLRAGAAYLPIDPATPDARVAAILDQTRPVAVVTTGELAPAVSVQAGQIVRLDQPVPLAATARLPRHADPRRLAYLIATSGSTGVPKIVEVEQHSLVSLVRWHQQAYAITAADRASLLAAVSFDASVWEIWPYLTAGATLVMPADNIRRAPHELARWLADEQITISFVPTPVAEEMLSAPPPGGLRLRALLTGGDVLHAAPGPQPFEVWNHYGPTECTVVATRSQVTSDDPAGPPPPIGRPIANVETYVLSARGQVQPVGVVGELHLAGRALARGYHRDPEATRAAFGPHRRAPDRRLYRTGDLVRRLPDGRLRFVGRADSQLKVHGVRIEAADVIAQLVSHPAVRDAVVVPHDGGLAAYVVPRADPPVTAAELRAHLAARLPAAVIPSSYTMLAALPLTAHDKVDPTALPSPLPAAGGGGALATQDESIVAQVFGELLNANDVGPDDDFFALGGHSLLATRLVIRIQSRCAVAIPLRLVFENGTVRALAGAIDAARQVGAGDDRPPLRAIDRNAFRSNLGPDGRLAITEDVRAALGAARSPHMPS